MEKIPICAPTSITTDAGFMLKNFSYMFNSHISLHMSLMNGQSLVRQKIFNSFLEKMEIDGRVRNTGKQNLSVVNMYLNLFNAEDDFHRASLSVLPSNNLSVNLAEI